MDNGYQTAAARPRSFRTVLLIALSGIILGVGLVIWGLSSSPTIREYLFGSATPIASEPPILSVSPPAPAGVVGPSIEPLAVQDDARIAALEARVADLGRATANQSGGSGRAEGLLLAFAARRALDRGLALGYIEGQLNAHFGQRQPRAVAMIIAAARQPVTLDALKSELGELVPKLAGKNANESWWSGVTQSLSHLFIVRNADAPSTMPAERLTRASDAISLGRVDQALAEVARLPNRDLAADWMAKARRHVEAYRALDLLEASAIVGGDAPSPPAPSIALPEPETSEPADDAARAGPDSL